jgi:nitroreductase
VELSEAIEKRRSVRQFKPDPVPGELLDRIIKTALKGPSAGAVRGYGLLATSVPLTPYNSPACLVAYAMPDDYAKRYGDRGRDLYAVQDATIAAAYAQLAAVDLGLATVWVGAFRERVVQRAVGLHEEHRPVAVLAVGYEAE